jgi:hypothetical protein
MPPLGAGVPTVSYNKTDSVIAQDGAAVGVEVKLPDKCKTCGSPLAVIGEGNPPHWGALHCKECRHGWVSEQSYRFVYKIVEQFGRLNEPIHIHRGNSIEVTT